ncbi:hypothetical protein VKT23_012916 [Stygiomarasmius scandens]|uniref:Uncharacterized protein n=1 Tax=Marasmiellus scandens TaxID=2682957 RepID=A0ABR1J5Y8_9AGAR
MTETKRHSSNFFSSPSQDIHPRLAEHRRNADVEFARSPFKPKSDDSTTSKLSMDSFNSSKVAWSDLLLEIAMTTAFASLTDGTPILEASNVASYLSFFALVWWIWASRVAYNVRFCRADWLHRMFVFFQVFVFWGLAAFTNDFNVVNGIVQSRDEMEADMLEREVFVNDSLITPLLQGEAFRKDRLPVLNVRGISVTMALSRLLLLFQYLIAFYHAHRSSHEDEIKYSEYSSFLVHIGSLVFSSLCYFAAFGILITHPDKTDQIIKLVLWYFPLLVEVAAHFIAASRFCQGRVDYDAKLIWEYSATVFVIILGGGLDNITNGFQFTVGNVSFEWKSLGLIFGGVVIFLLLFSLYFSTAEPESVTGEHREDTGGDCEKATPKGGTGAGDPKKETGKPEKDGDNMRVIGSFFFFFFYLSAIIVTLQGIAAMLKAGNIGDALDTPFQFLRESKLIMELKGFGVLLNESDYVQSTIGEQLQKQGIELSLLLSLINEQIDNATTLDPPDFNLSFNALLQADEYVIETILANLNSVPDDSLLLAKLDSFYYPAPDNYILINNQTFNDLVQSIIISNTTPVLWFYAAGGAVLVTLALVSVIGQSPRDKFEWGQVLSRLLMGSAIILLTSFNVHASKNILTEDFHYEGSRIWFLATHSWVLPPYAVALFIEQIAEVVSSEIA